jgi:hypothetical protein
MPKRKTVKKDKMFGKYERVKSNVRPGNLELNQMTPPKRSGRYNGTAIGRDDNGFFATTHRARSKSYESPGKIPDGKLKKIASTG